MKLIKFEIGEGGMYAYREKDKEEDAKVFYDRLGKKKIYCDLHKHTQLRLTIEGDCDMPHCPRCVELGIKEYDDMDLIRVPYIEGLK